MIIVSAHCIRVIWPLPFRYRWQAIIKKSYFPNASNFSSGQNPGAVIIGFISSASISIRCHSPQRAIAQKYNQFAKVGVCFALFLLLFVMFVLLVFFFVIISTAFYTRSPLLCFLICFEAIRKILSSYFIFIWKSRCLSEKSVIDRFVIYVYIYIYSIKTFHYWNNSETCYYKI